MKRKLKEVSNKSDGIYYVICINDKWRVEAYRTDRYGKVNHDEVWENYLTPHLARIFKLSEEDSSLLKLSYAGFPRGRIENIGTKYFVYHGNNYKRFVAQKDILAPFGIKEAKFRFDDHERVIVEHRETIRELLHIEESWPGV